MIGIQPISPLPPPVHLWPEAVPHKFALPSDGSDVLPVLRAY